MKKFANKLRLKMACWLLSGLPENVWIGRYTGSYTCKMQWSAGRMDPRGVLQGYELGKVFDAK